MWLGVIYLQMMKLLFGLVTLLFSKGLYTAFRIFYFQYIVYLIKICNKWEVLSSQRFMKEKLYKKMWFFIICTCQNMCHKKRHFQFYLCNIYVTCIWFYKNVEAEGLFLYHIRNQRRTNEYEHPKKNVLLKVITCLLCILLGK